MNKIDFFIVGAPKCGTTAMADYLAQHPGVFMPENKDSNSLGQDVQIYHNVTHPPDKFGVGVDQFLQWFDAATPEQICGDASVLYLVSEDAAAEIYDLNPQTKIIAMLRNPVDMLHSLHGHMLADMNEDVADFESALALEEGRKQGLELPPTCWCPTLLRYRDIAKYTEQVERYYQLFGAENVHTIIYDDFKCDPQRAYQETLHFLGVDDSFNANIRVVNGAKRLRSKRLMKFIVNPPWPIRPVAKKLSQITWLRNGVNSTLLKFNTVQRKHPPMEPELRTRLHAEMRPEVERLSTLLQRDLTHWCEDEKALITV